MYAWGSSIKAVPGAETTVIAHEATADSQGGWVLLQDGAVRQMTHEEFAAANKATEKR